MGPKRMSRTTWRQGPSNRGFSLIELLVVVAVILIIMAIAIPNFIKSKLRANEASTVSNIRNITTAEVVYSTTYEIGFSADLISLGGTGITVDQTHAGLIDDVLANGQKSGYLFTYTILAQDPLGHVTSYSVNADPLVQNNTGVRHFYADQTGVIRENDTVAAGPTDPSLQ
jgi:type IV pilus assembly protein PilA